MKNNKGKQESMVKTLRDIRDKINHEIQNMTNQELKDYFRKRASLHPEKYKELSAEGA